jgi:hypothetical protein
MTLDVRIGCFEINNFDTLWTRQSQHDLSKQVYTQGLLEVCPSKL